MVAYSFNERFCEAIVAGRKRQTVRADRKRHAKPGEMLQLYIGMRTKHCVKIMPDVECHTVETIVIGVDSLGFSEFLQYGILWLSESEINEFARADGFADAADMHAFWLANHGIGRFKGVVIKW